MKNPAHLLLLIVNTGNGVQNSISPKCLRQWAVVCPVIKVFVCSFNYLLPYEILWFLANSMNVDRNIVCIYLELWMRTEGVSSSWLPPPPLSHCTAGSRSTKLTSSWWYSLCSFLSILALGSRIENCEVPYCACSLMYLVLTIIEN